MVMRLFSIISRALIIAIRLTVPISAHAANAGASSANDYVQMLGVREKSGEAYRALMNKPTGYVDALRGGIGSTSPKIVVESVRIAGALREDSLLPDIAHLATHEDELVRIEALQALGVFMTTTTVASIDPFLSDKSPRIRVAAMTMRARVGGGGRAKTVDSREASPLVILAAAVQNAVRGDARQRGLALKHLASRDEAVQRKAIELLALVGGKGDIKTLQAISSNKRAGVAVRGDAWYAAKQLEIALLAPAERRERLSNEMRSNDLFARRWAALELIRSNDPESLKLLKAMAVDSAHPGNVEANEALSANSQ